ncbi:histidinol-phosphatase HisJ family protein [Peloplasma aerotolerans]|jgi:histidinol-phosphatase (PHP family)|uniref:Histidinol-phosphatase n=1 Tax=Peloplasma aerotolerans TaxID=3044389 RepID=A0AAW6U717_9MOLU|nr:histidinol-phosphatase HisJ family protein [Mariniplasma sp. M4Ah]MDI6453630.1 histidinol-phosphatase HisJ family protein [Mariniplasma sp. M4Ah]
MNIKLIDHHMHTQASPDADPNLTKEQYIEKAMELNLPGVLFTDHVDFDFFQPIFHHLIDYDVYEKNIEHLKKIYPIDILMGVEIGYQKHLNQRMDDFLKKHQFDFVICSTHMCDGLDLYNGDFFKGKTQQESYQRYFENVLYNVENYDNYDVYGHIDYIIRYGGFEVRDYDYELYKDIIDKILMKIIENHKGIELNTSGIRYGLGVTHPKFEVIKRFKELGGKYITLGSDAHYLKDFQNNFKLGLKLLKEAGFTYVTQYKNRKPYQVKIA